MAIFGKRKKRPSDLTAANSNERVDDIFGASGEYNGFYDKVSVAYRAAELLLLAALIFYVVFAAIGNAGSISYDSLGYVVRNFSVKLAENGANADGILYNPDSDVSFAFFGKGLAVAGSSGINIFSPTGRLLCDGSHGYSTPVLASSEKYALVFDGDGEEYAVYNSFSEVWRENSGKKIYGAAVSDDGWYALIVESEEYTTAVELYDKNFRLVNRFLKNGYVTAVSLDDDKGIAVATVSVNSNGEYETEIMFCEFGKSEISAKTIVRAGLPLRISFVDGGVLLLCDDALLSFAADLSLRSKFDFDGGKICDADVTRQGAAVVLSTKNAASYRALVFSQSGDCEAETTFSGAVSSVVYGDGAAYINEHGTLLRVGADGVCEHTSYVDENAKLLYCGGGRLYVCASSCARSVVFETR